MQRRRSAPRSARRLRQLHPVHEWVPRPVAWLQLATLTQIMSQEPLLQSCCVDAEPFAFTLHVPLAQVSVHLAPAPHSRSHVPLAHASEQVESTPQLAVQVTLGAHVKAHV
jgi:hypothetical protein